MATLPSGLADFMNRLQRSSVTSEDESEEEEEEEREEELEEEEEEDDSISIKACISERFTRLQAAVMSTVIQEALDKIKILGLIGGLPSVITTLDYQSIIEKYEKEDTQSFIFDPETLEPYEGSLKKQMLIKFQKDRSYIEQVLEETYEDIVTNLSINKLMHRLIQFRMLEKERQILLDENRENVACVKRVSTQTERDKVIMSGDLQKKGECLGKYKDEYEDLIYENDIKYRYIDSWEKARNAQNFVEVSRKEEDFTNTIREYSSNYERENRINIEIEAYLTEMGTTHLNDIEFWMDKYDKDFDAKEIDIQDLKEKREEQIANLNSLTKLYADHKKEIEDYLVEKEERRKREELLENMNRAATKIQAWWRGVMFRRGLGPYRKKKGKKGKGSGKGKKK